MYPLKEQPISGKLLMETKETNYRKMKVFWTEARGGSKYNDIGEAKTSCYGGREQRSIRIKHSFISEGVCCQYNSSVIYTLTQNR